MDVLAAALTIVAVVCVLTSPPAHANTEEDQVRAVLDGMNGSYNRSDFDAFAAYLCTTMRQDDGFEAGWYQSRSSDGPTRISVNSVDVSGNDAVANVRFEAANRPDTKTLDIEFLREGTEWKACRYHAGQFI